MGDLIEPDELRDFIRAAYDAWDSQLDLCLESVVLAERGSAGLIGGLTSAVCSFYANAMITLGKSMQLMAPEEDVEDTMKMWKNAIEIVSLTPDEICSLISIEDEEAQMQKMLDLQEEKSRKLAKD